ncbi:hypothetical protein HGM15179_006848 [Zosterops borbonicus]|uniref:Reverse transcriptase n=1 Tax=Zosterops borbonicus TaxID=364589 RepID=A0A8K1GL92_9PASS|nr:hypothetical protein HGM15179_006848 [Zosterops borbonicus]
MTYQLWQSGEVLEDCQKPEVTPVFKKGKKDPGKYWPVSLISIPDKVVEHSISVHMDDKKVITSSQHGFTKGKSCLTNLIAFCDKMTTWMDKGRAVGVVCLSFSKTLTLSQHPHSDSRSMDMMSGQ